MVRIGAGQACARIPPEPGLAGQVRIPLQLLYARVATQVARSIRHVPSSRSLPSDHHVHEDDEEEDGGVRVEAGLRV